MAKAKKKEEVREEPISLDPKVRFRNECLQKVKKAGYDADYDGSVLVIHMTDKDYASEEKIEEAKSTIIKTGYDASYGFKKYGSK